MLNGDGECLRGLVPKCADSSGPDPKCPMDSGHFGPGSELTEHFGTNFVVLKCPVAEVCGTRKFVDVRTSGGTTLVSGVGLVIERLRVRLPAAALPGSLGQLNRPSLRGR